MDDDNTPRYKSYLWLVILLVIAILICFFIRSPDKSESPACNLNTQKVEDNPTWEFASQKLPPIQTKPKPGIYESLNANLDTAIEQLKKKSIKAKRIIPHFPDFPQIWLLPPKDKGSYGSLGERYTIEFMELLFPGYSFPKVRPKWLKNPETNYPLELDGFSEDLMLAVEYQGEQHYNWPNRFHRTLKDFMYQRDKDQVKVEICIERNICLLRIPYLVPLERIPLAIYAKLLEAVPGLD